jgi:flagellar hook assembly protein FlgD
VPDEVRLTIYDINGRLVENLMSEQLNQGKHSVVIDGSSLVAGVYFVNLSFNSGTH